jgi:hypothetical protein
VTESHDPRREAWHDYRARLHYAGMRFSDGVETLIFEAFNTGWRAGHAVSEPVRPEVALQSPGSSPSERVPWPHPLPPSQTSALLWKLSDETREALRNARPGEIVEMSPEEMQCCLAGFGGWWQT